MITKITLVLAMCMHPSGDAVSKRMAELRTNNPQAIVSLRVDKKAKCNNGQILSRSTKEAEILAGLK